MRKLIFLLSFTMVLSFSAQAQYYVNRLWTNTFGSPIDSFPWSNSSTFDTAGSLVVAGNTTIGNDVKLLITSINHSGTTNWTETWEDALSDGTAEISFTVNMLNSSEEITLNDGINYLPIAQYNSSYTTEQEYIDDILMNVGMLQGYLPVQNGNDVFLYVNKAEAGLACGASIMVATPDMSATTEITCTYKSGAIKVALNNNYLYVIGATYNSLTNFDFVLLKYDHEGSKVWEARYNGTGNGDDFPTAMAFDGSGNIYVTGMSAGSSTGNDFATVMYNSSGVEQWATRYDFNGGMEIPMGIVAAPNGSVYVTGGSSSSLLNREYVTIKYSNTGSQQGIDRKSTGATSLDIATGIVTDENSNIYITGVVSADGINYDYQTIKYNSSLSQQWSHIYDGDGKYDEARNIAIDGSGNLYVNGYITRQDGRKEMRLLKYNNGGAVQWTQIGLSETNGDNFEPINTVLDNNANIAVASTVTNGTFKQIVTTKFDAAGNYLWERYLPMEANETTAANDVKITENGEFILVSGTLKNGSSQSYISAKYSNYNNVEDIIIHTETGMPICVKDQVLIRFHKSAIEMDKINNSGIEYGLSTELLKATTISKIQTALEYNIDQCKVFKVIKHLSEADSLMITNNGDTIEVPDFYTLLKINLPNGRNLPADVNTLTGMYEIIRYTEPNYIATDMSTPNDASYSTQASLHIVGGNDSSHINIEKAWDYEVGSDSIRVAVIESGVIDWRNFDFKIAPGDTDITRSKISGYNYEDGKPIWRSHTKISNHATSVGGIIGALRNNDSLIAGIAGGDMTLSIYNERRAGATLLSLPASTTDKIFSAFVSAASTTWPIFNVHDRAIHAHAVHIINNSWGFSGLHQLPHTLYDAAWFIYSADVSNVVARGNIPGESVVQPANLRSKHWVMSVGASGTHGKLKDSLNTVGFDATNGGGESSYGAGMDFIAPGHASLVKTLQAGINTVVPFTNTSASAPHVSGVAALMQSIYHTRTGKYLTPDAIEYILRFTAKPKGSAGYDSLNGYGLIDAGYALKIVSSPAYTIVHGTASHTQTNLRTKVLDVADTHLIVTEPILTSSGTIPAGVNIGTTIYKLWDTLQINLPLNKHLIGAWANAAHSSFLDRSYKFQDSSEIITVGNNQVILYRPSYKKLFPKHKFAAVDWFGGNKIVLSGYTYIFNNAMRFPLDETSSGGTYSFSYLLVDSSIILATKKQEIVDEMNAKVYPNPSSDVITLECYLPKNGQMRLDLMDIQGRSIITIDKGMKPRGSYTFQYNTQQLSPGTYIFRLQTEDNVISKKFIKLD